MGPPVPVLVLSTLPCTSCGAACPHAGKGSGLSITPFAAGHLLGGAIWRISTAGGDELVYAVDFHHRKERHLYSMGLQNLFTRPAILIVDAASQVSQISRQLRPASYSHLCLKCPDHPPCAPHCLLAYFDTAAAWFFTAAHACLARRSLFVLLEAAQVAGACIHGHPPA